MPASDEITFTTRHKLIEELLEDGFVTAKEVLRIRREMFRDGVVDMTEAAELFTIADALPSGDKEWFDFFKEAMTDYFVRQNEPTGYISAGDAAFLIDRMGPAERLNPVKHDCLIHLLNKAVSVPKELLEYALTTVRTRVIADGRITAREVDHLRLFLFAAGGDGNVGITTAEAELMFDLNDACRGAGNASEWTVLFKQVIANYLMAHFGWQPISRDAMLGLRAAPEASLSPVSLFRGAMDAFTFGRSKELREAKQMEKLYAKRNATHAVAAADAAQITPEETYWLLERIGKDGDFDPNEEALLAHLQMIAQDQGGDLPMQLQELLNRAA